MTVHREQWTDPRIPTSSIDDREAPTLISTFFTPQPAPTHQTTTSSNPFDQVPSAYDPDINTTVQDYARELSTLLNRMPKDMISPLLAGLHNRPPTPTVQTFDLLGLGTEDWASPILPGPHSTNPFDSFPSQSSSFQSASRTIPTPIFSTVPSSAAESSAASTTRSSSTPSMASTDHSDASSLTIPEASHRLHVAPNRPADRHAFSSGIPSSKNPVKVFFLRRYVHRRGPGIHGSIFRWHLRVEESYPGAFSQWQINILPGEYLFEDFNNSFVLMGQKPGCEPCTRDESRTYRTILVPYHTCDMGPSPFSKCDTGPRRIVLFLVPYRACTGAI